MDETRDPGASRQAVVRPSSRQSKRTSESPSKASLASTMSQPAQPSRFKRFARHPAVRILVWGCLAAFLLWKSVTLMATNKQRRLSGKLGIDSTNPLQDIVKWDEHSLSIRGERVMIMSGEVHPFRLPVPSLWLDVFQKVKALGFNAVSFYTMWALHEGKPGHFTAEGAFALGAFFQAANDTGIYLIARPGPYINAEVSGGGFPGWLQGIGGHLRTRDEDYLAATDEYAAKMGEIIAKAQITNGGPVILYQPENEYSVGVPMQFPDGKYMQRVEDQAREAGIVVPLISNDAAPLGNNVPGSGFGAVDIYGHDAYPLLFDCSNPTRWPPLALPIAYHRTHKLQSPSTPFSLVEFQGGSYDSWGGAGYENCAALLNHEFERVFYKNNIAAGVAIHNIYMIFGGTNWGNIGHPGGYTSYDYGAAIREDRSIDREKYSELKLLGEFLKVSRGYLTTMPGVWKYADNPLIYVTRLEGNASKQAGSFYVVRHTDYSSTSSTSYKLKIPTLSGTITIPRLFDSLTLNRRDSKIMVTDYDVRGTRLLYSTAEVFTHQRYGNKTVLVVYTGPLEMNELAIKTTSSNQIVADDSIIVQQDANFTTLAWATSSTRRIVQIDDLHIHILDRNAAHKYWVPEIANESPLIITGPYLVRNASMNDNSLLLSADFNRTTTIEIFGAPDHISTLLINGKRTPTTTNTKDNAIVAQVEFSAPKLDLPTLSSLPWHTIDSLPELQPDYDDSLWPHANKTGHQHLNHTIRTHTSLLASDYGFHSGGALLFRGHFTATGHETSLLIHTQGGTAYAHSIWLNGSFVGSFLGNKHDASSSRRYSLPPVVHEENYVITVLVDTMGLDETPIIGLDGSKSPRGIISCSLWSGWLRGSDVQWKITGNLGGEDYADHARGPLNEGGLFFERMGYHLPRPPLEEEEEFKEGGSPFEVVYEAGVRFYVAEVVLDLSSQEWDLPLWFEVRTVGGAARVQIYVNGWLFGEYVSNIGPQEGFHVPEGILDYEGENWIGLSVWSLEEGVGTRVERLELRAGMAVLSGRGRVEVVGSPVWRAREGAY